LPGLTSALAKQQHLNNTASAIAKQQHLVTYKIQEFKNHNHIEVIMDKELLFTFNDYPMQAKYITPPVSQVAEASTTIVHASVTQAVDVQSKKA
jgi:hypothetical protein